MTFQTIRLVVAAVGVAIWAYGYRVDSIQVRWFGIAILAIALVLRFLRPRKQPVSPAQG